MKIHVLTVKETDPFNHLQNLLIKDLTNCSFQVVPINKLPHKWNALTAENLLLIVSNYPIDTPEDAFTILRFIKSFGNEPQAKFYSPRPNKYLPTEFVCIFGSNRKLLWHLSITRKVCSFFKKIYSILPLRLQNKIRKMKRYLELTFSSKKMKISKVHNNAYVPVFFRDSFPNSEWTEWRDSTALRRDLVDRCQLYYPHPISMHIAISNLCNLKCKMCPYHSPTYRKYHKTHFFEDKKLLSKEIFRKIAIYAGKNKISLQFGQIEEPLLHPSVFEFIQLAKDNCVPYIHLTTNGTLLTKEKAKKLSNSGVDSVMFSVDAVNPETYKTIRGGNLTELEANIDYFLKLAKKKGIKVTCSFIKQPISFNEQYDFIQKWKNKGVDGITFYVLSEHNLSDGEVIRKEFLRNEKERYPCASPWVQSVIMPDGSVGLCCKTMTDIGWKITSVGNIYEMSFEEIWLGEKYKKLRKEILEAEFDDFTTCVNCPIWSATFYEIEKYKGFIRIYNETMETIYFD